MIALDSDILTLLMRGDAYMMSKLVDIDVTELAIPIVVVEEVLRGRLQVIRQSQAGKSRMSIEQAYELFETSLIACMKFHILSYTKTAEMLFKQWRAARIRVPTQDLRIAAICAAWSIPLATRNVRDFNLIPGLTLETWN